MERKPRGKRSIEDHDDGTDSSDDDSSVEQRRVSGQEPIQEQAALYQGSHVASVCEAINTEAQKRLSPFEELMLEKRRETNRLSARRRRKRRRDEIKHLQEEQHRLEVESAELTAEKTRLQHELNQVIISRASSSAEERPNVSAFHQRHDAQPPSTHGMSMVQLLLLHQQQQQQQQQHLNFQPQSAPSVIAPSIIAPFTPSMASLSRLMPPSASFDLALLGNIRNIQNAAHHPGLDSTSTQQHNLSLELLRLLPLLQTIQGQGVASLPLVDNRMVPPPIRPNAMQIFPSQMHPSFSFSDLNRLSAISAASAAFDNLQQQQPYYASHVTELSQNQPNLNRSSTDSPSSEEESKNPKNYRV